MRNNAYANIFANCESSAMSEARVIAKIRKVVCVSSGKHNTALAGSASHLLSDSLTSIFTPNPLTNSQTRRTGGFKIPSCLSISRLSRSLLSDS